MWPLPEVQPNPISWAAHESTLLPTFLYKRVNFYGLVTLATLVLCKARGWVTRKLIIPTLWQPFMNTGSVPVCMCHHHFSLSVYHSWHSFSSGSQVLSLTVLVHIQYFNLIFILQYHFQRFLGLFTLISDLFFTLYHLPNLRYLTGTAKLGTGRSRGMLMRADPYPAHSWIFERKRRSCLNSSSKNVRALPQNSPLACPKFAGNQFFYLGPQNYHNRRPVAPPIKSNNHPKHVDPSSADHRRDNFHIIVLGGWGVLPWA